MGTEDIKLCIKSSEAIPCETKGMNPKNSTIGYNTITLKSILHVTGTYHRKKIWQRLIKRKQRLVFKTGLFNVCTTHPCARNQNEILHLIRVLTVCNTPKNCMKESIFVVQDASFYFSSMDVSLSFDEFCSLTENSALKYIIIIIIIIIIK